jgi:pimeloyl-ACP methyl ester carboxylesterase
MRDFMSAGALEQTTRVQLPDGRHLCYACHGPADGEPVFLFHGEPGSRLFMPGTDAAIRQHVRLITVDRPGYGRSDLQPGRTLLDWAGDIACLADHLEIERFSVLGVSGGGPHALACAYRIPERLRGVAIASSPCPFDYRRATDNFAPSRLEEFTLAREAPAMLRPTVDRAVQRILTEPEAYFAELGERLDASDGRLLATPEVRSMYCGDLAEAVQAGGEGWLIEAHLLASPWPFDLGDIRVPVRIWHGERDRIAPPRMARLLWRALSGSELRLAPGEGHLFFFRHIDEILQSLVAADGEAPLASGWRLLRRETLPMT